MLIDIPLPATRVEHHNVAGARGTARCELTRKLGDNVEAARARGQCKRIGEYSFNRIRRPSGRGGRGRNLASL